MPLLVILHGPAPITGEPATAVTMPSQPLPFGDAAVAEAVRELAPEADTTDPEGMHVTLPGVDVQRAQSWASFNRRVATRYIVPSCVVTVTMSRPLVKAATGSLSTPWSCCSVNPRSVSSSR
jgi:hypothetical protein